MAVLVNIVSGKGGAGKSLLTAVLADSLSRAGYAVLAADLDVFVRGLTALLSREHALPESAGNDSLAAADFFCGAGNASSRATLIPCREFDLLPAVNIINELLNFRDLLPDTQEEACKALQTMLACLPKEYDFIFLDSRAGYDEWISAAHQICNFSICVEEEDDVSRLTSDNLMAQLRRDADKPVWRIRNKVRRRGKQSAKALSGKVSPEHAGEILSHAEIAGKFHAEIAGEIPFDTDIMESFGSGGFWAELDRSMYRQALCKAWNHIAESMSVPARLNSVERINPLGSRMLENRLAILSTVGRILFVFGFLIALMGLFLASGGAAAVLTAAVRPGHPMWGIIAGAGGLVLMTAAVFASGRK